VVAVTVHARGRDEPGQALEQLEGGEQDLGAAVHVRLGEPVEETAVGGGQGGAALDRV
jgi:hypothetical protein